VNVHPNVPQPEPFMSEGAESNINSIVQGDGFDEASIREVMEVHLEGQTHGFTPEHLLPPAEDIRTHQEMELAMKKGADVSTKN